MFDNVVKTARRGYVHTQIQSIRFFAELEEKIGAFQYEVDLAQHTIRFYSDTDEVDGDAFLVASVAVDPPTVMWSHAEQLRAQGGEDIPELLLEFAEVTDFDEFSQPEVPYAASPDRQAAIEAAFTIENTLVFMVGPGFIPWTFDTSHHGDRAVVIVSIDDVPELTVTDLVVYGPRVLTLARTHDQLFYLLDGMCDIHEWQIEDDGETITVSDGAQTVSITVDFSDESEPRFNFRNA